MWGPFILVPSLIVGDIRGREDVELLEGIHGHNHISNVCLVIGVSK